MQRSDTPHGRLDVRDLACVEPDDVWHAIRDRPAMQLVESRQLRVTQCNDQLSALVVADLFSAVYSLSAIRPAVHSRALSEPGA